MTHRIQATESDRGAEESRKLIVHRAAYLAVRSLQLIQDYSSYTHPPHCDFLNSRAVIDPALPMMIID
jgi:hypothetical protein